MSKAAKRKKETTKTISTEPYNEEKLPLVVTVDAENAGNVMLALMHMRGVTNISYGEIGEFDHA
jgi:hypothetical protein